MDTMPGNDPMEKPEPLDGLDPAELLKQGVAEDTIMEGASASFHPPAMEEIADAFPQFEILELIGQGGMGAVYKVRQKDLDRIVALKILPPAIGQSPELSDRFTREARALAKLNHPGIVTLHEFGQQDGLYFILMEFVDGVNLAQLMKTGRVSPREALAIVPQICDALQYAHDQGIVHRDIKPENLLLDRQGRVKVADFGIAKVVAAVCDPIRSGDTPVPENQTLAGKIIGTPQYMAPEQIAHPSEVDHRADIYALGVVFYQMLTGELPGKDLQAPSRKVHIDVRLDEIVLQALEKKPELRYQTAGEFRTRVETVASEKGSVGVPPASFVAQSYGNGETGVPIDSRFSRAAIVGACWAPLFFVAATLWFATPVVGPAGRPPEFSVWFRMLASLLGVIGVAAPFGTTILGWIAVSQIRRSAGKLHGMWLAVCDGLLFPLLLLAGLIGWFWHWVFYSLIRAAITEGQPELSTFERLLVNNTTAFTVLATLITSLVTGFFIIRRVWRAVNATDSPKGQAAPDRSASRKGMSGWAVAIGCGMLVAVGLVVAINMKTKPREVLQDEFMRAHQAEIAAARERAAMLETQGRAGLALLSEWDSRRKPLASYDWKALADEGRLEAGELAMLEGNSCLKIENPGDDPLDARLLTIINPPIRGWRYAVRGELRHEDVRGRAYLETWNVFPEGRFFTRANQPGTGPMGQLSGTSGWRTFILPFDRTGTDGAPSRIELNLHLPGKGTVFIGPLELVEIPPGKDDGADAQGLAIFVSGEVHAAGSFQIAFPVSLLDAVASAGGWTEKADIAKVWIRLPGETESQIFDMNAILKGDAVNPIIVSGATVFVPEK